MKKSKIILVILAVLFLVLVGLVIGKPMTMFMSEPEKFQMWVESKGIWGILAFIGMNAAQVLFAVIPGGPFEIGAGYAFGIWKGSLICDIAMTLGSVIIFLLVHKFGMKFIELFVSKEKVESIKWLKTDKKSIAFIILFYLIPGTPKDLFCYLLGLTDMKLWVFILINFLGRFPAIILSASSGGALGKEKYVAFFILMAVIVVMYIIGALIYRHHNKKLNASVEEEEEK